MQFPAGAEGDDVIKSDVFGTGLEELARHGLHFEYVVHADRLPAIVEATRLHPDCKVVLNHCGLNDSGQDFDAWKANITALAACSNAFVKLSAIEEWKPVDDDPGPYLDHALREFGPARCMFGGNWFVPVAFGKPFKSTLDLVAAALDRMAANDEMRDMVFAGTATSFYRL